MSSITFPIYLDLISALIQHRVVKVALHRRWFVIRNNCYIFVCMPSNRNLFSGCNILIFSFNRRSLIVFLFELVTIWINKTRSTDHLFQQHHVQRQEYISMYAGVCFLLQFSDVFLSALVCNLYLLTLNRWMTIKRSPLLLPLSKLETSWTMCCPCL